MNTHISLELAKWLKERGCEIESELIYSIFNSNRGVQLMNKNVLEAGFTLVGHAYSWYDILVTHAKEFWGWEIITDGSYGLNRRRYAWHFYPHELLDLLWEGLTEEAEAYVREHSIFSKQDPK